MSRTRGRSRNAVLVGATIAIGAGALLAGCGQSSSGPAGSASGKVRVAAAENFWGSIASQLGGAKVEVRSIIVNPNTDPHSYEPTAQDARTMAGARLAIVNGVGYDNWAPKLLEASPDSERVVLNVGEVLGLHEGDNPHRWYFPSDVRAVIASITADYRSSSPRTEVLCRAQAGIRSEGPRAYNQLRAQIRASYAGVPVGYSESIFQGLGEDLGLRLLTPYSFAKAIAEGTEVTAQDKQAVDEQAERHRIEVWVFNSQNVTPDVQRVNEIARAKGIPIATVTETLSPAGDSFEQWQVAELEGLAKALHRATGR